MVSNTGAKEIIERIFRDHPEKDFSFVLWDGSTVTWDKPASFTITFKDPEIFQTLMYSADPAQFAEAYVNGQIDVTGDFFAVIALGVYLRTVKLDWMEKMKTAFRLGIPSTRHTKEDDARDVQAHYDLSNDFYKLFLDEKMVYSSAFFETPETSLEKAQERKLDLICRKLRLKPGESFLDVGCGWGALVMWAAKNYGVKAHGITLSKNQFELATQRVRDAGLSDRVTIELRHYLDLPQDAYDKISSVGMIEHVGIAKYPEYFGTLYRSLKSCGLMLNHGITQKPGFPDRAGGEFVLRHVFPGSELDSISHTLVEIEKAGFEVLDVESLRRHYALTLREWMKRYLANETRSTPLVPEKIPRIWKLYLSGCAMAFEEGLIGVDQVLCAKTDVHGNNVSPLTREDLYRSPLGSGPSMA